MNKAEQTFKILKFLNVDIINQNESTEFIFNIDSIKELKKNIINLDELSNNYSISIEDDAFKVYIKTLQPFSFKDCDVIFDHNLVRIIHGDIEILEYMSPDLISLKKYQYNPEIIYFKIIGIILKRNVIIQNNMIGIEYNNKLFQLHIFNDGEFGLRQIFPSDTLREIQFKKIKEEKIIIFKSITKLFKK